MPAESNPPGDIPDNLAFVAYGSASGHYRFAHPEGWAEQVAGSRVLFTDKLNGVTADAGPATSPPTVADAKTKDVPELRRTQAAFELRSVAAVKLPGGSGVRIVYRRNSAPDAVTGRQYRDEVERYELVSSGHEVVLEMYGPVGADNVDAYRTMVNSLRIA
ncbi:MAG: lipoprotein [Frankiales bacterium]|nr:lipoprotein [Frankiales bacterium]